MKRKTVLILVTTAIAGMAFAGVALSLAQSSSPIDPPEGAPEAVRKAPGVEVKSHRAPVVDGEAWGLRSYDNVRSELCLSHDVPGEAVGTSCMAPEKLFADGPLFALPGARQVSAAEKKLAWDNVWVFGIAHPSVQTLTLVNMDCSTTRLSLDADGAFNHVVGADKIKKGELPYKLVAHGAGGEALAEKKVSIGLPLNAKKAGLEEPRPRQACS